MGPAMIVVRDPFSQNHSQMFLDSRTLQGWMRHRDIKSAPVYLKGILPKDAMAKR